MADLDAELLALAGDDSSGEEVTKPTTTITKTESPPFSVDSPANKPNGLSTGVIGMAQKKSAPNKPRAGTKKGAKKGKRDDSEEEGEASSTAGSPNSLQSAPMSESDSDASPTADAKHDGPVFPVDNQFYSEKDKAEIMSLSEVQRESILAERAQLLERKTQDLQLRRLLQAREKVDPKTSENKKRKAGVADLEDTQRKSSRQKTTLGGRKVGESSDAMEAYKRQREQKGQRDEQRRREGEERRDRKARGVPDDGISEADAEGDSELEWDDGKPKTGHRSGSPRRDEEPATMRDFEVTRIGRDNFAQVCYYPGFDDAIKGCFARINIGADPATGEVKYRCAQIKGFTTDKPYAMTGPNGRPFTTDQHVVLAMGKSEKPFPFNYCSNSKFTEDEFDKYKRTIAAENLPLPTKPFLISKVADINRLVHHRFTEAEIQEKLRRSGVLKDRFAAFERNEILNRRRDAEARDDEAAIAKADVELAALEGPKLANGANLTPAKPSGPTSCETQQDRLAALNRLNRKLNAQDVRRAQHAERRAEKLARKAIERGEAVANPFARVKTRAKTHYDVTNGSLAPPKPSAGRTADELFEGSSRDGSRDGSRQGTPSSVVSTNTSKTEKAGTPSLVKRSSVDKKYDGMTIIRQRNMDDDILGSLDFGIEIDF